MDVISIIAELLRRIPDSVRFGMNAVLALVVVAEQICRAVGLDLPYEQIDAVLVILGGYLGVQSAANIKQRRNDREVV